MVIWRQTYGKGPLRLSQIVREETHCRHMGYSFWLAASVLLYASSHRQDNTYHSLYYTSRGTLAGTRNSSMGPPWRIDPTTHRTMSKRSYHGATSRTFTVLMSVYTERYVTLNKHTHLFHRMCYLLTVIFKSNPLQDCEIRSVFWLNMVFGKFSIWYVKYLIKKKLCFILKMKGQLKTYWMVLSFKYHYRCKMWFTGKKHYWV